MPAAALHDAHLRNEVVGVVEGGFAQVDDRVPVTQVGSDLGLVHEAVSDEVGVAGTYGDLLGHPTPEAGAVHVAGVLVEPAEECRVGRTDTQQSASGFALRRTDQLVDELVLGGHRADQVVRPEEHVRPVVALQLPPTSATYGTGQSPRTG
ncbi:hypothetical protein FKO01_26130 [Mesorhizobium sp. B2-3-3]|uniref:hypothetical protein n=1 Tax=Streptomyces TaxID=1883 RepID=UPI001174B1A8|nr:hypothetical protein [Streptomyces sp. WI03-5b]MDX2618379.1 hypothetical protein [Streptomyces sp. WI03-5b]TPN25784.1 hypothetical protein FKO01_26130 [Mesorhizobium sp. B2-3-3]